MRTLIVMLVAVSLVLSTGFIAGAAPKSSKPQTGQTTTSQGPATSVTTSVCNCPSGWHRVGSCGQYYTCKPDIPQPVQCPQGAEWQYNESNCTAGCVPPPPK